jgi:hypothetical protein
MPDELTRWVAEQFGKSGAGQTAVVESTGTGGGFKLLCARKTRATRCRCAGHKQILCLAQRRRQLRRLQFRLRLFDAPRRHAPLLRFPKAKAEGPAAG